MRFLQDIHVHLRRGAKPLCSCPVHTSALNSRRLNVLHHTLSANATWPHGLMLLHSGAH